MSEDKGTDLKHLLNEVEFRYSKNIDYGDKDSETVIEVVHRITDAAKLFNMIAITDFGGRTGPEREKGLTEHAVGAAFQTFGGEDPHPTPFDKAAMLLRGITQGHPFNDGNKRTGFLVAAYYLEQVGIPLATDLPTDEVVNLCLRISSGEIRQPEVIAHELEKIYESQQVPQAIP